MEIDAATRRLNALTPELRERIIRHRGAVNLAGWPHDATRQLIIGKESGLQTGDMVFGFRVIVINSNTHTLP